VRLTATPARGDQLDERRLSHRSGHRHHISITGTALIEEIPSGDVVNTVAADAMRIGGAYDVMARFVGSIVAWIVVSFILLSTSSNSVSSCSSVFRSWPRSPYRL